VEKSIVTARRRFHFWATIFSNDTFLMTVESPISTSACVLVR